MAEERLRSLIEWNDLKEALTGAGIRLVGVLDGPGDLIPPVVAFQAVSCPPDDERTDAVADIEDPLLRQKANSDWYRLSFEGGLFSEEERRFLLGVSLVGRSSGIWCLVELVEPWDIMGKGAAGPLGSGCCRPEFVMLSRDGEVLVCGTTGQFHISTLVVKRPGRSGVLRRFAHWVAGPGAGQEHDRAAARRWLDSHPLDGMPDR